MATNPPCTDMASLTQMALLGNRSALEAALETDPHAVNRPLVGGIYDSRTLLMCAASRGHTEMVSVLLRCGADTSFTDKRGATSEALARKQGHTTLAELLAKAAAGELPPPPPPLLPPPTESMASPGSVAVAGAWPQQQPPDHGREGGEAGGGGKRSREGGGERDAIDAKSKAQRTGPSVPTASSASSSSGSLIRSSPTIAPSSQGPPSAKTSSSAMTMRIRWADATLPSTAAALPSEVVHTVADAEGTTVGRELQEIGSKFGVRLLDPLDAKHRSLGSAGLGLSVFAAWLEHGDSAEVGFETDLVLTVTANDGEGER
jgi:hypothetical protein